jgi:hypothetical protein
LTIELAFGTFKTYGKGGLFFLYPDVLKQYSNVDNIHILSHGKQAEVALGNATLSRNSLAAYQPVLQSWSSALSKTAEILLYGCHVAKDVIGQQFIQQLSTMIQVNIAASHDITGAKVLGGNWELAFHCGQIRYPQIFSQSTLDNYAGILATETISFDPEELSSAKTDVSVYSYTKATKSYSDLTIKLTDSDTDKDFTSLELMSDKKDGLWDASYLYGYPSGIIIRDDSSYQTGIWFAFATVKGNEFDLVSIDIGEAKGSLDTVEILGYRDGKQVTSEDPIPLKTVGTTEFQTISLSTAFDNVDEVRIRHISSGTFNYKDFPGQFGMVYGNFVFQPALTPTITSATYDAGDNYLIVTGTNMVAMAGADNDIDAAKLTLTGQSGVTYTLTSSNVEITSATEFAIKLNTTDQINIAGLLNKNGTSAVDATSFNIAAADNWNPANAGGADLTGNTITVSNIQTPTITSATYNAGTGTLVVTGTNFVNASGAANDITANKFTFTGEGGATYTLTNSANVEITSGTAFTLTLSTADKAAINQIVNKNGISSTGGTAYNLAAADDWNTVIGNADTSDTTGNGITVSNVAAPAITSATYNASIGALIVTGTGFLKLSGATNDIVANKFTFTGEGGATYTLTDSANVEITSATAFTLTLSATDKAGINQITNKNGTSSTGGTTYNLAAAEDWATGADAAVVVADLTGNGMTVANVAVPTITSTTYDASTGSLAVVGTGFLSLSGVTNDIIANKFTFTGEGGATYTLTDSANVEITSATAFTLTLSTADKAAINQIINKNGTSSTSGTTYNLAATEDWAAGADAAVNIADLAGNGITVTIPPASPGGGGNPAPTTKTIDGVTVRATTQSDGTVITTVLPVSTNRHDDPISLFSQYADIPVTNNSTGDTLLTVSLPTGVGLNIAGKSQSLSLQAASNDITQRIAQKTGSNSSLTQEIINHAQNFLATLAADERVTVQAITPSISNNQLLDVPIIITGSNSNSDDQQMLIVDAGNLPSGTTIQLDNVAFASIIGAARVVGGNGENFVVGDNQNQYIVLGTDDDTLFGGGGNDTIGSLAGNDQTSGDAGDDIVFGGTGNDLLSGGTGNDQLNGGFGFDSVSQEGQLSDYQVATQGSVITLTQSSGEVDTFTDVELIRFTTGSSLSVAYSAIEAVAHHLVKTWLGRDLTVAEGEAVQSWAGATPEDILTAFHNLPEAATLQDKTSGELLAGLATDPTIIQLDANREIIAGDSNDAGYLPLGLALNVDGGMGHDVLHMLGNRDDVHLEFVNDRLELTRLNDGAMLSLNNAEMIAFDSGETVVIAHNQAEDILARLIHSFFDRDATSEEWQLGREALDAQVSHRSILNWFQQHAGLANLPNTDYVQTIYTQTLGRAATDDELDQQLSRLDNNQVYREWLAVEIAQSTEAAIHLVGSVMLQEGWV